MAATIVALTPGETERLRVIRLQALSYDPDAFASTLEDVAAKRFSYWKEQASSLKTFVAIDGGSDVGMVRGAFDSEDRSTAWLLSMWVMPEFRGRGVGDLLVEALVRWAHSQRVSRILLDVGDSNVAAIALYERQGFHPNGKRGTLPPPRDHITEHQRVLVLAGC